MAENFTQGQATSTTNNATVSIEVDTSVRYPSIAVHQSAFLT